IGPPVVQMIPTLARTVICPTPVFQFCRKPGTCCCQLWMRLEFGAGALYRLPSLSICFSWSSANLASRFESFFHQLPTRAKGLYGPRYKGSSELTVKTLPNGDPPGSGWRGGATFDASPSSPVGSICVVVWFVT